MCIHVSNLETASLSSHANNCEFRVIRICCIVQIRTTFVCVPSIKYVNYFMDSQIDTVEIRNGGTKLYIPLPSTLKSIKNKMEWSESDVYKVINLYRQFPCLWDFSNSHYKRHDLKRNAWMEIAKKMEKDEQDVKKKVKNLRCAYVSEKRKVDSTKISGCSTEDIYHPQLFYYGELKFLNSAIMFRKTISSLEYQRNKSPTITYGSDNCITEGTSNSEDNVFNVHKSQESLMSSSSFDTPITTKSYGKSYKRKWTEREEKFNIAIDDFVKQAEKSCSLIDSSNKQEDETMYSAFGKSVALQLAQLSLDSAVKTMSEIQQILTTKILTEVKTDPLQTTVHESKIV